MRSPGRSARELALLVGVLAFAFPANASTSPVLSIETKVASPGSSGFDFFGTSPFLDGDLFVVGIPGDEEGSARLFERDAGGLDAWGALKDLHPPFADPLASFGSAVRIDGDTVVVGAPKDLQSGLVAGSAFLFERDAGGIGNWGFVKQLVPPLPTQQQDFGRAVGVHGDVVVVGVGGLDEVRVYERDVGGPGNWGEVALLTSGAFGDSFADHVAIDGDFLAVSASTDGAAGFQAGAVYIFERNSGGADNWGEVKKLVASDAAPDHEFGHAIALHGDTLVVGSPEDDEQGTEAGAVYVFQRDAGGVGNWGEVTKVTSPAPQEGQLFGWTVALHGDRLAVAALGDDDRADFAGAAYVFERDEGGASNWGHRKKLTASDAQPSDRLSSVAVGTDVVAATAPNGNWARIYRDGEICPSGPTVCTEGWEAGTFLAKEQVPGKEKLVWKLAKGPSLSQADFGTPLDADAGAVRLCVYDDGDTLISETKLDRAGGYCSGKPCWRPTGGFPGGKGYVYRDKNGSAGGIALLTLQGGTRAKIRAKGANNAARNRTDLPVGVTSDLDDSASVTVQLHVDDQASCFTVSYADVKASAPLLFKAKQ